MELLSWWNLPFILPFLASVGYILLMATGAVSLGHDADIDHDVDLDHDADMDHGVEQSTEIHHSHEHNAEHDTHHPGLLQSLLGFLGVGRVPISVIFTTFCLIWGFAGFAGNELLKPVLRLPMIYFWVSAGVAFASSVILTGFTSRAIARIMPTSETYACNDRDLVGLTALVSLDTSEKFGRAQLHDPQGNFQEITCVIEKGEAPIRVGERVILNRLDPETNFFIVSRDPRQLKSTN